MNIVNNYSRRILLAVTGLSPQIVTETLYALYKVQKPAFMPTEVHLLTTTEGKKRASLNLLSEDEGWFHRLRKDYALPAIHFNNDCIHVLKDINDEPLHDICTVSDNEYAADTIVNIVRELTQDEDTAIHVSIAGGRKTMGFHVGYALSLYGRVQDRLSHVLVSGAYESHPNFYYPTPYSRIIHTYGANPCPMDTKEAEVMLAEIPFVCLRDYLPEKLLDEKIRFSEAVQALQAELTVVPVAIELNLSTMQLRCGNRLIKMPPALFVFYAWFVWRKKAGKTAMNWINANAIEYLQLHKDITDSNDTGYQRAKQALKSKEDEKGFSFNKEAFEYRRAKVHKVLKTALGERHASAYLFKTVGKRPNTCFEIGVLGEKITIITPKESLADKDIVRSNEHSEPMCKFLFGNSNHS